MAIVSTCLGALGQGKVTFGNDANHLFVLSGSVFGGDNFGPIPVSPLSSGLSLVATLYAGNSASALVLQTSVVLDVAGWLTDGRMVSRHVILTNVPGAAPAYFQIFITDDRAVLPDRIDGRTWPWFMCAYLGMSGLFTATPGASLSFPGLVSGGPSASTWAPGNLTISGPLSYIPPHFTETPSNTVARLGDDVTFRAQASSLPFGVVYQWSKEFSPVPGATNRFLTLTNVTLSDAGNYEVLASDAYCSNFAAVLSSATLTVFLPAIAATLGSPTYTTNNHFQFTVTGTAGSNYVVQVATNLSSPTTWVSLFTNASPFTFVDSNAQNFPQRFYRTYAP